MERKRQDCRSRRCRIMVPKVPRKAKVSPVEIMDPTERHTCGWGPLKRDWHLLYFYAVPWMLLTSFFFWQNFVKLRDWWSWPLRWFGDLITLSRYDGSFTCKLAKCGTCSDDEKVLPRQPYHTGITDNSLSTNTAVMGLTTQCFSLMLASCLMIRRTPSKPRPTPYVNLTSLLSKYLKLKQISSKIKSLEELSRTSTL